MILRFPSFDVLQLALTSEIVAPDVQCAPARLAETDDDAVLIDTKARISRDTLTELKRLGVCSKRKVDAPFRAVSSWQEALPLASVMDSDQLATNREVLLEIEEHQQLPLLVSEMLRLGNDRQSFRFVEVDGATKTLLRVTAPPYYTMLRAIDQNEERQAGQTASSTASAITAYAEQTSRVWVEMGYRHPLGQRLNPPAGKCLLISRDGRWRLLNDEPFRDVYKLLEFTLPRTADHFVEIEPAGRIQIPLKLTRSSSQPSAELWVLEQNAIAQIEDLVRGSDDREISRLAFAVVDRDKHEPLVILRARPSRQSLPVLVLDALACRPYLKIPNLFLPVDQRLHPPLRRDTIIKLLAGDPEQITWLKPLGDGAFKPQSISDSAFRPLSDWVEYVIDHQHEALQSWIASHQFDFEHFVCRDDVETQMPRPTQQRRMQEAVPSQDWDVNPRPRGSVDSAKPDQKKKPGSGEAKETDSELTETVPELKFVDSPSRPEKQVAFQIRLGTLEKDFRSLDEPIDGARRRSMWREMASLHAALKHRHDATICAVNAVWLQESQDSFSVEDQSDTWTHWLHCEQKQAGSAETRSHRFPELILDDSARSSDPTLVAALVAWAASREEIPPEVARRKSDLVAYLLRREKYLPVRAAWLAWQAMYRMTGNDILLLARARDRLLDRLFHQGLSPEFDMASFLRAEGTSSGDRLRVLRQQLPVLQKMVGEWIVEPAGSGDPQTKSYADLVFCVALARLGENVRCRELLEKVEANLSRRDPLHRWVFQAYQLRVQQTLAGKSVQEELSESLLEDLESMERMDRYKLDRLRSRSQVLEPHATIDPFQNYHQHHADGLSSELAKLQSILDRGELQERISDLQNSHSAVLDRCRILAAALPLSPRLGEEYACDLLDRVAAIIQDCKSTTEQAMLLQRALHIAAHFGRVDRVHKFVLALHDALPIIVSEYLAMDSRMAPATREQADATEQLLSRSFQGLRKLGMRDQIRDMYARVAALLSATESDSKLGSPAHSAGVGSRSSRLLLCLAGGWYYFGDQQAARNQADRIRAVLHSGELPKDEQKNLTSAYLEAVGQAPLEESLERIKEIFAIDKKGDPEFPRIGDNMATSTHFSISQLTVVEAAVASLIRDDFSISPAAQRWLDEDEFLVRSRIHRDMQQASENSSPLI